MNKKIFLIIPVIAALLFVIYISTGHKTSGNFVQVRTADSGKWVGFAPFYLIKAKGIDKKYGIELKIDKVGNSDARRQMLSSGQVDFLTPTIDGAIFNINAGMDVKIIMAYDTSYGGDGIVAKNDIKSFIDLKGKTVGATKGFTDYFLLKYLMNKYGLKDEDINIVDMPDEAIGPALITDKIDAGAMMEPWISKVVAQKKGHLLISSKDTPNLISDIVLARSDSIKNKKNGLTGIVRAWFDALDYWKKNQEEANVILAKEYGMTEEEFVQAISSVRWLDKRDNLEYFGNINSKGQVYEVTGSIINVAKAENLISKTISSSEVIDSSILYTAK